MRSTVLLPVLGLIPVCLVLATGCNDDGGTDNTDETDTEITYESGCIEVSSASQGFANLEDALAVAEPGATVELCDDFEGTIVISTEVNIVGNGIIVTPDVNAPAFQITGDANVSIDNVDIVSTKEGFIVEAGATLNVTGVDFDQVDTYGIDIAAGATVVADDLIITEPDWGGIRVNGGTLTLTNSEIVSPGSFGVRAEAGSIVTLEGNTISNIANRDPDQQFFELDGVGVWLDGSTGTLSGNIIGGATIAGVNADARSTLTMDGDEIYAGVAGILNRSSAMDVTGVTIQDYEGYGVVTLGSSQATFNSVSVTTDPTASRQSTLGQEGGGYGSIGLYAIEAEITVSGTAELPSEFRGNNSAGIIVSPQQNGTTSAATVSDTVIDNNKGFGIAVYTGELDMTDVTITNTQNDDENCITDTGYSCNMAVAMINTSGSITDAVITDNNDWGVIALNGVLEVNQGLFARNSRNSVAVQAATLALTGTTFDEGMSNHVTVQGGATGVVDGATFSNGNHTTEFEYQSGDDLIRTVNYYQAQDVLVSDGTIEILNSTFINGERGMTVYGGGAEAPKATVRNTTFTGYNQQVLNGSTGSEWTVESVQFKDVGRYVAYCYSCSMSLKDVSIENTTKYKYKYDRFINDELQTTTEFEQASEVMYMYLADISLEDVTIDGADGRVMYAYNSSVEFDGVEINNAIRDGFDRAAVDISWVNRIIDGATDPSSYPNAVVNKLSFNGQIGALDEGGAPVTPSDALYMSGWTDADGNQAEGVIEIVEYSVVGTDDGTVNGDGLELANLGSVAITGLDISGVRQAGLRLDQTSADVTGKAGARGGIIDTIGDSGIVIDADRGVYAASAVSLTDVTVTDSTGNGIEVNSGTHTFSGVTVTGADGWGAVCVDATFDSCDASLEGALGAHDGCGACSGI